MAGFSLQGIGRELVSLMVVEVEAALADQGHKASGRLAASLEGRVRLGLNSLILEVMGNDYIIPLNTGREAGKKRVPISALLRWLRSIRFKGTSKKRRSAAFAIQAAIFKEGSPTSGSFRFSTTGKRTGFLEVAGLSAEKKVNARLEILLDKEVNKALDRVVEFAATLK